MRPEEFDDVFAGLILKKRADLLVHDLAALKRRTNSESIHDTRVQSRRMRAALETFQDLFPPQPWEAVYESVRMITRNLGKAREAEVSISLLRDLTAGGDVLEQLCGEYLEERFERRRLRLSKRLSRNLRKTGVRNLRARFAGLLAEAGRPQDWDAAGSNLVSIGPARGRRRRIGNDRQQSLFPLHGATAERANRILGELAPSLLAFRPRSDFRRATDSRLHRLRIRVKKLRYAMEIFNEAWPGSLKEQVEQARKLQEAGGRFQDWSVLCRRLDKEMRRLARHRTPSLSLQMGRIFEQARDRKAVLRKEILPALVEFQSSLRELMQNRPLGAEGEGEAVAARATQPA